MYLNFEQLFKATLIAMKMNRSHPFVKRDKKWLIPFILVHGVYTTVFIIIFQNILLNVEAGNITETCKNGTFAVVYIGNTFSYIILLWQQSNIADLIRAIKKDYVKAKTLPKEEQDIIYEYAKKGEYVCKQWFIIAYIGSASFVIKNFVLNLHSYIQGDFKLIHIHELVYPSIIENRKESMVMFIPTYILMVAFFFYSSSLYISFVPLGPIFMVHATGQLVVMRSRIDVVFKSGGDIEEIRGKLNGIIKELQYIYDFVDRINECFKLAYEACLKLSSITLPIACYEIIESLKVGEIGLEFITFIIGGVLFSSSPCYYSDLLMEKGEELRQSIYFSGWEDVYCRRLRSTLRVMLQRAVRPVAIRSLFRVLCLEALTDVFRLAYTLFNLMNAAWK